MADGCFCRANAKASGLIFHARQRRDALTGLHLLSQRDEYLGRSLCALLRADLETGGRSRAE
ncbi:MAG: hypothetical protein ACYC91_15610 [Solirubrobacteraceae bacterium]